MLTIERVLGSAAQIRPEIQRFLMFPVPDILALAACGPVRRKKFFRPLYAWNGCAANCGYCGFRRENLTPRTFLTPHQLAQEAEEIRRFGCDTAYVLGGSLGRYGARSLRQTALAREALLAVARQGLFPVLELAPQTLGEFRELHEAICKVRGRGGRFVLFQEVYDRETYMRHHGGPDVLPWKGTPDERLAQPELALQAGWPEVGIGTLLGLGPNLAQELACLIAHAHYLRERGVRHVTISVPRLNPATGADTSGSCSDDNFIRAVCIISLYCRAEGMSTVITGRETAEMRNLLWRVTDIWGVRGSTAPGGYTVYPDAGLAQFSLRDSRSIPEILTDNPS